MEDNDTNEWIDKVLASAKGKEIPDVNPFLFTRIEHKISSKEILFSSKTQFRWAMTAIALLILNIGVILFTSSETKAESTEQYQQLSESYFQSDSTNTVFYSELK
jgi:hypothetical protein